MIFGHDVSHHQPTVDVGRLAARFVIARTGQAPGTYYDAATRTTKSYGRTVDSMYQTHKANARRAGKTFGAYFYLGNSYSAAQNAAMHASIEPDRKITVMLDWEHGSGDVPFLRACKAEFEKLGYRVNLTYAPKWYLNDPSNGGKSGGDLRGLPPVVSSKYPDYVARSVEGSYAARSSSAWESYGGNTTLMLQFTSSGRDASYPGVNLDCIAFGGTEKELAALFGVAAPPSVSTRRRKFVTPYTGTAGKLRNMTIPVPQDSLGKEKGLVIGQGWITSYWASVKFIGHSPSTGSKIVKTVYFDANNTGGFPVDGGRPWEIDVPELSVDGPVVLEAEYKMTVPATIGGVERDVVGGIEFV